LEGVAQCNSRKFEEIALFDPPCRTLFRLVDKVGATGPEFWCPAVAGLQGLNFTNNSAEILGGWQSPEEPGGRLDTKLLWSGGTNFINQPDRVRQGGSKRAISSNFLLLHWATPSKDGCVK